MRADNETSELNWRAVIGIGDYWEKSLETDGLASDDPFKNMYLTCNHSCNLRKSEKEGAEQHRRLRTPAEWLDSLIRMWQMEWETLTIKAGHRFPWDKFSWGF